MRRESEILSRYFDGELKRDDLPPELRAEAARFDRLMATLDRRSVKLPSIRDGVMKRVRADARSRWSVVWQWAAETQTVRISRLGAALALAATIAIVVAAAGFWSRSPEDGAGAGVVARFVYIAPQASSVAVTGDFAHWEPAGIPLQRQSNGTWMAEIRLQPGLHHYVFVIDGTEWRPDPNAASQVDDGFGQRNSVLLVAPQES